MVQTFVHIAQSENIQLIKQRKAQAKQPLAIQPDNKKSQPRRLIEGSSSPHRRCRKCFRESELFGYLRFELLFFFMEWWDVSLRAAIPVGLTVLRRLNSGGCWLMGERPLSHELQNSHGFSLLGRWYACSLYLVVAIGLQQRLGGCTVKAADCLQPRQPRCKNRLFQVLGWLLRFI